MTLTNPNRVRFRLVSLHLLRSLRHRHYEVLVPFWRGLGFMEFLFLVGSHLERQLTNYLGEKLLENYNTARINPLNQNSFL